MSMHGGADTWIGGEAVEIWGRSGRVREVRKRSDGVEGVLKAV